MRSPRWHPMANDGPTLIVGQIARPTGMARVTAALAGELSAHRDVAVLGLDASPADVARRARPWRLYANEDAWDGFAERSIARVAARLRPSCVLLYHNPDLIPRLRRSLDAGLGDGGVVAAYCPIDAELSRLAFMTRLRVDGLAVPSAFGRRQLTAAARQLGAHRRRPFCAIEVLRHGVDRNTFRPLDGPNRRRRARQALLPDRPDLWDGVWVLNANRDEPRKRLDQTVRGFASFARGLPRDVRLCLPWAGAPPPDRSADALVAQLGIAERLLPLRAAPGMSTARLNLLYNACDIGVNTTAGEGFGLVALEHAATGAAQIVPDHSASGELWAGAAMLLPARRQPRGPWTFVGADVDPEALAAALRHLYEDVAHRDEMARRARGRAGSTLFRWDRIGGAFHRWLSSLEQATSG